MFSKPISWLGMEETKPNTTKAHIRQSKEMYYNTKKTKARFSRLLRHPAWKQMGPILISELHKFVIYLLTHLLTAPGVTHSIKVAVQQFSSNSVKHTNKMLLCTERRKNQDEWLFALWVHTAKGQLPAWPFLMAAAREKCYAILNNRPCYQNWQHIGQTG